MSQPVLTLKITTPKSKLSRRQILQTGLAAAVGIAGTTALAGDKQINDHGNLIDPHSHIWTRDVKNFPLANNNTVADLAPPSFTAEECLKEVRSHGVSRVVLIQHHIYHGWDNSYLIDAARRYPEAFVVVGMIDDTQPHPEVKMRKLLKKRVKSFRITSWIRGKEKWLQGPGMAAMWKCAAKTGQAMGCLIDAVDLPAVDLMCKRFPDTPVVIDHFARIGIDGQLRDSDIKQLCALAKHKNTHLKISAYYALGKKKAPYTDLIPMMRRVLDAYGVERCMWASDSPYQTSDGHHYGDSINLIRKRIGFLSAGDRQWLLRKTAEKVYFS